MKKYMVQIPGVNGIHDRFGYCVFDQMGEFNENSDGKKECVFYDTNSQGHDYLEGRQTAWKSIEFVKPKSLGLYHPKSIPNKMKEITCYKRYR